MKINFLLRMTLDSWSIKNRTCATCKFLNTNGVMCTQRKKMYPIKAPIVHCYEYIYLRSYKKL